MRPTVAEQLEQLRRLLSDDVAPEVFDPRASELLQGVVVQLGLIAGFADDVLPFLAWDNEACRALLEDAIPTADPATAERIRQTLTRTGGPTPLKFAEANARNNDLRDDLAVLLQQEGPHEADTERVRHMITAHLAERAARYPMRMNLSAPTASSTMEA